MKYILALVLLATTSCLTPRYAPPGSFSYKEPFPAMNHGPQPGAPAISPAGTAPLMQAPSTAPTRPLVGWDGGVVESPRGGSITPSVPVHAIGTSEQGRMQILELYQGVIDERDILADEVIALQNELSHRDGLLAQSDTRIGSNDSRITELEADASAQAAEIEDLLGRLTTAQIRRLEAEKLVLETKLAEHDAAVDAALAAGDAR